MVPPGARCQLGRSRRSSVARPLMRVEHQSRCITTPPCGAPFACEWHAHPTHIVCACLRACPKTASRGPQTRATPHFSPKRAGQNRALCDVLLARHLGALRALHPRSRGPRRASHGTEWHRGGKAFPPALKAWTTRRPGQGSPTTAPGELPTPRLTPLLPLQMSLRKESRHTLRGRKGAKRASLSLGAAVAAPGAHPLATRRSVGRSLSGLREGPRSPQEPRSWV